MPSPIAIAAPEPDAREADETAPVRRVSQRGRLAVAAAILLVGGSLWGALQTGSARRSEGPTPVTSSVQAAIPSAEHPAAPVALPASPSALAPSVEPIAPSEPITPSGPAPELAPSEPIAEPEVAQHTKKAQAPAPAPTRPLPVPAAPKAEHPAETELPDPNLAPARSIKSNVDEDALQQALAQAAQRAKGCHVPGGPTGNVRVSVTFAPSGDVTGATVQGAAFSNTLEGECIAAKFRALHIPAFSGSDFVTKKAVSIE